jgi:hypothetical protein
MVTGNVFAPSSGPGDSDSYFPVGVQDQWVYDYTSDDPNAPAPSGTLTVTVTGTKTVQNVTATVFSGVDSNAPGTIDEYYYVSDGGVTALGNTDPGDPLSPLLIPYAQLLFPVSLGQVSQVTGTNLPFGNDANNNPVTLDITQTITNSAMETVDVPAGTFSNALKQTTTANGTAHDNGQSAPISATESTWYVPGVGEIKDVASASGAMTTINSSRELRRYTIDGQLHGIGPSASLTSWTAGPACQGFPIPTVASDGTNFLIVTYACGTAGGTQLSNWLAVLAGPDGTVLKTINLTAPGTGGGAQPYRHAVSGFDGTHYLVIYEDTSQSPSTMPLMSVVLDTTGSIVAGPTMVATEDPQYGGIDTDGEALGFDGSHFLLAYTDGPGAPATELQLTGLFIAPGTGQPAGAAFAISQGAAGGHGSPAIAYDGTNYLVVWVDTATAPQGLFARRVSPAGALVDVMPIAVADFTAASSLEPCCDLEPTVSFDGTNYLAAYRDPRNGTAANAASISAARISKSGTLLDGTSTTPGIVVAASKSVTRGRVRSIFASGAHWLVWESSVPQQLNATRVTTTGVPSPAWTDGFTIVPPADTVGLPVFAGSSAGPLLVWQQYQTAAPYQWQTFGLRIYPTGP